MTVTAEQAHKLIALGKNLSVEYHRCLMMKPEDTDDKEWEFMAASAGMGTALAFVNQAYSPRIITEVELEIMVQFIQNLLTDPDKISETVI